MTSAQWMIYGATGFTGVLVAEEALRRGHRPVLAGRSREKLEPLARRLGLEWRVADLADRGALGRALEGISVVLHAAGPFVHTAAPMIAACLDAGSSYLDVTGEIPALETAFSRDRDARERNIAILPGVGFDVVPTDCLAKYVADRVPGAVDLELAVFAIGRPSTGTAKSVLEMLPHGNLERSAGVLRPRPLGGDSRRVRFTVGERNVVQIPMGDLETAYRTTGIPNIRTYMAMSERAARVIGLTAPALTKALSFGPIRRAAQALVARSVRGPDDHERMTGRSYVWARAVDSDGREAQAWLETVEGYRFTAEVGVRSVERVMSERPVGALTPAIAFGRDFVLEVEGTKRMDTATS